MLCLRYAFWSSHSAPAQRHLYQQFYGGHMVLLLILAMNKQLGFLIALTSYSRLTAIREGWYNTRRLAQLDLIWGLGAAAFFLLVLIGWHFRPILRQHWLPLVTAMGLLTYVAIRTVSYHAVDAIILDRVLGVPWDWLFELTGLCLLIGALTFAFYRQQGKASQEKYHGESSDSP